MLILNLNNNAIKDISILEKVKFEGLQALFLRNNAIKDISVFDKKKYEALRQLDLRNNAIDDIKSFDSIEQWIRQCKSLCSPDTKFILIGNKSDISEDQ